ncbi:MAG TPA: tryptophan synthase subunit alpha [Polyangiales bacterium]|nr:tryptophan synthase subunit alpha [Polyangiales bacterium]
MLEAEIRRRREQRDILLMTHIVLGYPSMDESRRVVEQMVEAGVDLMELQIPFSEPIADGPVILHANQKALTAGSTVDQCLELASKLSREFPIPFLFMSYYNVAFVRGPERFAREMREAGVRGAIIPDLPYEEGATLLDAMGREKLDPVFIYAPNTTDARMAEIAQRARGFIYCVARKGVTGAATNFQTLGDYLQRCRRHTKLPLALGFGVKDRKDVDALRGLADIAVVGSETIRIIDQQGSAAVRPFIASLR